MGEYGYRVAHQEFRAGREHEFQVFGAFEETPDYQEELARLRAKEPNGFVPWKESLALVTEHSAEDPTHPKKDFLRDLRIEVLDRIGEERFPESVKAWSTVGTPLDSFHSTDAILLIEEHGRRDVVKLDATLNPRKLSGEEPSNADVMVGDIPDAVQEEDAYLSAVETYADMVVRVLARKRKGSERRAA